MQSLRLAFSCVLPVLLFACNMPIDPAGSAGNGGDGGGTTSSSSTGGAGGEGGSTSSSSSIGGAGGGGMQMGTAEIRFINLVAVLNPALFDALHVNGLTRVQDKLMETQGTKYHTVPADGETQFTITDSVTEEVFAVETGVFLEAGKRYSLAYMPGNKLSLLTDDYSNVNPDNTRVNILNAEPAGMAKSWIGYWNGTGYEVKYMADVDSGASWKNDLPYAPTAMQLEMRWPSLGGLLVDWNIAAYVQVGKGSLVNVYVWNDQDCTTVNATCSPQVIGHYEDGHTATVEGSHGWSP